MCVSNSCSAVSRDQVRAGVTAGSARNGDERRRLTDSDGIGR